MISAARLRLEWAILLLAAILGASFLQSEQVTQRIDNQILDRVMPLVRPPISEQVTLIRIDNFALGEIGVWPWARSRHAELIDRLNAAGARAIVLDVLFIEPSDPEEDQALADAMARSGNVYLPHAFTQRFNAINESDPLLPLPQLAQNAAAIGHVAVEPDSDGVLRRFDLTFSTDTGAFPHLSVQVLRALDLIDAGVAERETALVPFQPSGGLTTFSAAEVMLGAASPDFLRDRIVLIGATAPGLGDRYSVAAGDVQLMSGVETQANLLNALLAGTLVDEVGTVVQHLTAAALLIALFLVFWYLPPRFGLYSALGVIAGMLVFSLAALVLGLLWFPPAAVIAMVLVSYPLWSWRRLSHVSRYLDREAARLMAPGAPSQEHAGLDYVTRQIERLKALVRTVHGSATFLENLIEAVPDAIIVIDQEGAVEMLNASANEIFPVWERETGGTFGELLLYNRASLTLSGAEVTTANGRVYMVARADLDNADSHGSSGEILALRDVTERRKLDAERQQMLEFLSHDMRTPQVAIVGLTRTNGADGRGVDVMGRIRSQAQRTLKLADDFVQLARLESLSIQAQDSDLGALIDEACDRAYPQAEAKRMVIDQSLPEEPCFAIVDASLIARMLDNLIGNAVKYSPEGSRVDVTLTCDEEGEHEIVISDQGPGLTGKRREDPFARFGAHATHAGPSAGLGLALVKKVIDAHGGTIAVSSSVSGGAQFTIRLRDDAAPPVQGGDAPG